MMCLSDVDEVLCGRTNGARMPRVTFYEGMRLRAAGAAGDVMGTADMTSSVFVEWPRHILQYTPAEVLRCIRDGRITIEPTVGMRLSLSDGCYEIAAIEGEAVFLRSGSDVECWSVHAICDRIRSGALAILAPEKESAKPVAVVPGIRLRSSDGAEHVVHHGDEPGTVLLAGPAGWAEFTVSDIQQMIATGELTVVEAPAAAPAFELDAACIKRDQRIAKLEEVLDRRDARIEDLEAKLRRAVASELLYKAVLDAIVCAVDEDASAVSFVAVNSATLKNAGGNPSYAANYMQRITNKIATLLARATAAEQKLADIVALGIDSLPAMYPIVSIKVARPGVASTVRSYGDGTWSGGSIAVGTFREALHAAVKAVGGKLPGDDAGPK